MAIRVGRVSERGAVYIGRPGVLGNPFVLKSEAQRAEVVAMYRAYFEKRLKDPLFQNVLYDLEVRARKGDLVLGCFCAPRACHGDVIKEYLERKIAEG